MATECFGGDDVKLLLVSTEIVRAPVIHGICGCVCVFVCVIVSVCVCLYECLCVCLCVCVFV
jgi:hypothetical protein